MQEQITQLIQRLNSLLTRFQTHKHTGFDDSQLLTLGLSSVTDGTTTVTKAESLDFISGATVTDGGNGQVNIAIDALPGGSTTQIQFNDSGTFGGNAQLTFDKTSDTLTVGSSSLAVFNGKLKLPVGTNLYP